MFPRQPIVDPVGGEVCALIFVVGVIVFCVLAARGYFDPEV